VILWRKTLCLLSAITSGGAGISVDTLDDIGAVLREDERPEVIGFTH
jgi:hypothetical protein